MPHNNEALLDGISENISEAQDYLNQKKFDSVQSSIDLARTFIALFNTMKEPRKKDRVKIETIEMTYEQVIAIALLGVIRIEHNNYNNGLREALKQNNDKLKSSYYSSIRELDQEWKDIKSRVSDIPPYSIHGNPTAWELEHLQDFANTHFILGNKLSGLELLREGIDSAKNEMNQMQDPFIASAIASALAVQEVRYGMATNKVSPILRGWIRQWKSSLKTKNYDRNKDVVKIVFNRYAPEWLKSRLNNKTK